ncbi:MAG: hypothetical protein QCH99_02395 [Candidatus Bathyarchaeota archaeon]|nr:hypothetical protein [Candidatus Bathyarchaeum tardum]
MNKMKTISILLVCLLGITTLQTLIVYGNSVEVPELGQKIPLTNDQIKAKWPSLPTAKQVFENEVCLSIDLRYCGKQASSMNDVRPDLKSPATFDLSSTIVNCTTTVPDLLKGGVRAGIPQIWLQYNSSIWIQLPQKYLQTKGMLDGVTQSSGSTWAVGMYANPQQITGSYDVWGVCTFGQWNTETFGSSGDYLGTAVLTVCSSNYAYQEAMCLDSSGRKIVYNVWSRSTGEMVASGAVTVSGSVTGQLYNTYIRYSTTPSAEWQMWWNFIKLWQITGDSSTRVITGNQANVVIESNCFTSSKFSGFSTNIGGSSGSSPLCSAVYLFNGNWKPSAIGDYAPAGYTYLGGTLLNGMSIGNQAPPSNWGSLNIGQTSSLRERFTIGAGLPQRSQGYTLWTYGTV